MLCVVAKFVYTSSLQCLVIVAMIVSITYYKLIVITTDEYLVYLQTSQNACYLPQLFVMQKYVKQDAHVDIINYTSVYCVYTTNSIQGIVLIVHV